MDDMLTGNCSADEMQDFLLGLQEKRETVGELVGAASAMRRAMVRVSHNFPVVLDTCGTGGDGSQTFNISTAAAIVIAAAGIPVAKHGNRKITSSTGSADVLAELGINLDASPEIVEGCLNELKLCFCFAPRFHPAMKHVAEVRKRITGPTIFNRLGPLCNPASANCQVLGVGSVDLQVKLAEALAQLGTEHSIVVRGEDGVDEVSLEGPTKVFDVCPSQRPSIREIDMHPSDFGLASQPRSGLYASDPATSAAAIEEALSGNPGPKRDAVLINAAAALWLSATVTRPNPSQPFPREAAATATSNLVECLERAAEAIDSGRALKLIEQLSQATHR